MQAVILAAGRGTRMKNLTSNIPKPLLTVAGKTLLEHKLDALPESVDEVIIIVGYLGGVIQKHIGGIHGNKRILYIEQQVLNGTGGALWLAKPLLKGSFLVMYADDIYAKDDIEKASCFPWSIVGLEVDDIGSAAKIVIDGSDRVTNILEVGVHDNSPGFLNTGLYCLDTRLFDYPLVPKEPNSPEYGLPQTIIQTGLELHLIKATFWLQITDSEDLKKAAKILAKKARHHKR